MTDTLPPVEVYRTILLVSQVVLAITGTLLVVVYLKTLERDRERRLSWKRWQDYEAIVAIYTRNLFRSRGSKCSHCGADNTAHQGGFCIYCGASLLKSAPKRG